jgi:mannose-1-phosphate guanylyltransferase
MQNKTMKIKPIILAGGSGQRLLPFLKYNSPKQFLRVLQGRGNLLQNTLNRFQDQTIFDKPIIIGSLVHRDNIISSIKEYNYQIDSIILEPEGRNTGPAIAAAALTLNSDTVMVTAPIDHYIDHEKAFLERLTQVVSLVIEENKIATLFVKKTTSESNYGHIKLGKKLRHKLPMFAVDNFIEKPEIDEDDENIVWNSGIYCMTRENCKQMILKNAPHILHHSNLAVTQGVQRRINGLNELILNGKYFSKNTKLSFDQILTMPYDPQSLISTDIGTAWEDVGIWSGIKRLCKDAQYLSVINKEIFKEN